MSWHILSKGGHVLWFAVSLVLARLGQGGCACEVKQEIVAACRALDVNDHVIISVSQATAWHGAWQANRSKHFDAHILLEKISSALPTSCSLLSHDVWLYVPY